MRTTLIAGGLALLLGTLLTAPVQASKWNGVLKLGGIYLDESENSDLSAVQETYNIYDGFNVTKILLNGQFAQKHFLSFNLTEINLDSRKGYLSYRLPNHVRFSARYDEHRQVFDPDRNVTSRRKGLAYHPRRGRQFVASFRRALRLADAHGQPPELPAGHGTAGWVAATTTPSSVATSRRWGRKRAAASPWATSSPTSKMAPSTRPAGRGTWYRRGPTAMPISCPGGRTFYAEPSAKPSSKRAGSTGSSRRSSTPGWRGPGSAWDSSTTSTPAASKTSRETCRRTTSATTST